MNELALFAGAGGGILGGHLLGWRTICAVEWEPYAASVLVARQNDKILPPFPIWDDVQTFDGKPWRGIVDVVSGGFPCQDISAAGKGAGINGKRSGMWKHMARIIEEVQPAFAYIENSPMLRTRGLGVVLQDIAKMGFDAEWGIVSAADVGAPHRRDRIWILATNTNGQRQQEQHFTPKPDKTRQHTGGNASEWTSAWWKVEPNVGRVVDGVAARVDRLKAIGNGQVPAVAATAWREMMFEFIKKSYKI